MKRILSLFFIVVIAAGLMGCAAPVTNTPKETPKPTFADAIEPTPTPVTETLAKTIIETSSGDFTVAVITEDGVLEGAAFATFTGEDLVTEYEYILAAIYYYGELGIDYTVGGFSGADVIMLTGEGGELVSASKPTGKYNSLEIDANKSFKYLKEIAAALAE